MVNVITVQHLLNFSSIQVHGTYRNKYRIYSEDIFYGKGMSFDEVSAEVLAKDLAERKSENPEAYRGNINANDLTENEFKLTTHSQL